MLYLLDRAVDLDEILYGGGAMERDLDAKIFNLVVSAILKLFMFTIPIWTECLHHSACSTMS
jgi:hypothetical protein